MKLLLKKIASLIPMRMIERYLVVRFGYPLLSYSQCGEDILISEYLRQVKQGFYVDVGAHDPVRFSNTYIFYRRGWRGINIDANPGSMKAFDMARPRDINLECAAGKSGSVEFHLFKKTALNTTVAENANDQKAAGAQFDRTITVESKPLHEILKQHLPSGQHIDLLTIDTEGLDLVVLQSNNWQLYVPSIIAVEDRTFHPEDPKSSKVFTFLKEQGYNLEAYNGRTLIFKHT